MHSMMTPVTMMSEAPVKEGIVPSLESKRHFPTHKLGSSGQ